jgi:hypothetical protein
MTVARKRSEEWSPVVGNTVYDITQIMIHERPCDRPGNHRYCEKCRGKGWISYQVIPTYTLQEVMEWWNNLASATKTRFCDTTPEVLKGVRRWESLETWEIAMLFFYHRDDS